MAADWAIVLATFLGPVAAVGVSLWREGRRDLRQLRFTVFRVLMPTAQAFPQPGRALVVTPGETNFTTAPESYGGFQIEEGADG
jgi:hypothetical protein